MKELIHNHISMHQYIQGKNVVQLNDNLEFKVSDHSFVSALFILECLLPDCSSIPQ